MSLSVAEDANQIDEPEGFRVHDEQTANWLVRKVVEGRDYRDRVKQWAKEETERAERDEKNLLYLYGSQLETWVRNELSLRGDVRRSLHLPAGRVGFRKGRPSLAVADASALAAWARAHLADTLVVSVECRGDKGVRLRNLIAQQLPDLDVRERVLVSKVRAHIEASGELPPGAEMEKASDSFYIS